MKHCIPPPTGRSKEERRDPGCRDAGLISSLSWEQQREIFIAYTQQWSVKRRGVIKVKGPPNF